MEIEELIDYLRACPQPRFLLVAGGSMLDYLKNDRWNEVKEVYIVLADERCVPNTHKDSNYRDIQEKFAGHYNFSVLPSNDELDTHERAKDYASRVDHLMQQHGKTRFDMALLGVGHDGHMCSLFNKTWHEEMYIGIEDSPKPPPKRITATFKLLEFVDQRVLIGGEEKSEALKRYERGEGLTTVHRIICMSNK